ncbi:MAG TPA: universal stress protein [Gemmataceae bacterium]|nr:universal stress protein [Gemmataceae bacterium]
MFPISTILHPTDFSPPSDHAFNVAYSLARDHGSRVIVLHVAELPLSAPGGAMIHPPPGGIREAIREQLHAVKAPDDKVPTEYLLSEGIPAAEILRVAQESPCDLIVMGIHGRTGLARLLMGSVAEQVVRKAVCPVLIVKTPLAEKPSS